MTENAGRSIKIHETAGHSAPTRPFEYISDFIELTPSEGKKHCLVIVDMWSKWVEAFPTTAGGKSTVMRNHS